MVVVIMVKTIVTENFSNTSKASNVLEQRNLEQRFRTCKEVSLDKFIIS